jgi:uncharacterized protein
MPSSARDADDVVAFLSDGASYGSPGAAVERIETHISIVFLVGERAFKLKRAVRFSYLDYSTPERRERYCRAELALNRRTAPTIYRAVRAVTREADGRLAFDGAGAPVDWVLEMRRFPQAALFDRMAEAGQLTPALMRDLTDEIARFHAAAEITPSFGGAAALAAVVADNDANLRAASPPLDGARIAALGDASAAALASLGRLLEERRSEGKVRRCHGDLHLRNVCLVDGRPTPFDCIEFSDGLACIDVLYDLAFLLMDLTHRGLRGLANIVFNRYLDMTGDSAGLPALPLFLSLRAAIRAHVLMAAPGRGAAPEAALYLALAGAVLDRPPPRLVAIGGLSGSGKSALAQALAPDFAPAPGARLVRSDVLRKRLRGVAPEERLAGAAYGAAATEEVYRALGREAGAAVRGGFAAIIDATFLREAERDRIEGLAAAIGVPFTGLWLEAPAAVLRARIDLRRHDASDADAAVLAHQLAAATGPIRWRRIDAAGDPAATAAAARNSLD